MAIEPIVVNTTDIANREMYVITAINSIQTIVNITANAVITAIMDITAIMGTIANLFMTVTIAITTNIEELIEVAAMTGVMGITTIVLLPLAPIRPLHASLTLLQLQPLLSNLII